MNDERLLEAAKPWIERHLGISLSSLGGDPVPVLALDAEPEAPAPLRGIKVGEKAVVVAREEWGERLRPLAADLSPDLIFSYLGAYELTRVTLPDGVGVWGPVWYLFADETTWRAAESYDVVRLTESQLADVDADFFWHSFPQGSIGSFGVFEEGRLVALASVRDEGDLVWEIGMDVVADTKGRGLGRAVVSAAARWTLDRGKLVLATTAPFNVPSARTLRSAGLRHVFTSMIGKEGEFALPPQPLGLPYASAPVYDYYPRWAMNQNIKPRPAGMPGGS